MFCTASQAGESKILCCTTELAAALGLALLQQAPTLLHQIHPQAQIPKSCTQAEGV